MLGTVLAVQCEGSGWILPMCAMCAAAIVGIVSAHRTSASLAPPIFSIHLDRQASKALHASVNQAGASAFLQFQRLMERPLIDYALHEDDAERCPGRADDAPCFMGSAAGVPVWLSGCGVPLRLAPRWMGRRRMNPTKNKGIPVDSSPLTAPPTALVPGER